MGFTGLPPPLQGRLRASALPPLPPSATAATFLLHLQLLSLVLTLPALQPCCPEPESALLLGLGALDGPLDGPSPLPDMFPTIRQCSDSYSISLPCSMQVLDVLVLPTPIMGEQFPGQQQQQQQQQGQPEPRWNGCPAAWGRHEPPSAAEVATDKPAAALAAQRPSAYKGLGSWGQQMHVVPLGEHCGSGKGAGVRAEGWSPKSRSSHGRREQGDRLLGACRQGQSKSENSSTGQK